MKQEHFLPKVNKTSFFKLTDFEFGYLIFEKLHEHCRGKDALVVSRNFSRGQRALYFWWILDYEVNNGGFEQFYANEYGNYMEEVITGLKYIEANEVITILEEVHLKYKQGKRIENINLSKGIQNSHNYSFTYIDMKEIIMNKMERYVKENPNEFCVDENGNEIIRIKNSSIRNYYDSGTLKEVIDIENDLINGTHTIYYEKGLKKSQYNYEQGKQVKKQIEWYENGELKEEIYIHQKNEVRDIKLYYDNGQISKEKHTDKHGNEQGESKEWYKNGVLKDEAINNGDNWVFNSFWSNGKKKSEIELINNERLIKNYWNEKGENLLKDGTGLYIREYTLNITEPELVRNEIHYLNHKNHGFYKSYSNGKLQSIGEYKNGISIGSHKYFHENEKLMLDQFFENGIKKFEKEYYENGNLKNEYFLHNGKIIEKHAEYHRDGEIVKITTINPESLEKKRKVFFESGKIRTEITYSENHNFITEHQTHYWENGKKKSVIKEVIDTSYEKEDEYFLIYSWDKKGKEQVTNGKGIEIYQYEDEGIIYKREIPYSNYKQNGLEKSYENGILKETTEYKNDEEIKTIKH